MYHTAAIDIKIKATSDSIPTGNDTCMVSPAPSAIFSVIEGIDSFLDEVYGELAEVVAVSEEEPCGISTVVVVINVGVMEVEVIDRDILLSDLMDEGIEGDSNDSDELVIPPVGADSAVRCVDP